jgi:2-methoxy-6-polyprenyl-1,4-benzoquinol methylase
MLDINANMLEEGKRRFAKTMYHDGQLRPCAEGSSDAFSGPQVSFQLGNAEKLDDVPDNSIDLYTIAFGIRNCTHVDRVLSSAYRVLKPGGTFACLEFSKVTNPLLAKYGHSCACRTS